MVAGRLPPALPAGTPCSPTVSVDLIAGNRRGARYAGAEHLGRDRATLAQRMTKRGLRGAADEVLQGSDGLAQLTTSVFLTSPLSTR